MTYTVSGGTLNPTLSLSVIYTHMHVCICMQHGAMTNLQKAKSLYVSRQQDYEKVKEQAVKAETESQSQAAAAVAGNAAVAGKADAKVERKKKHEDDALQKVCELLYTASWKYFKVFLEDFSQIFFSEVFISQLLSSCMCEFCIFSMYLCKLHCC